MNSELTHSEHSSRVHLRRPPHVAARGGLIAGTFATPWQQKLACLPFVPHHSLGTEVAFRRNTQCSRLLCNWTRECRLRNATKQKQRLLSVSPAGRSKRGNWCNVLCFANNVVHKLAEKQERVAALEKCSLVGVPMYAFFKIAEIFYWLKCIFCTYNNKSRQDNNHGLILPGFVDWAINGIVCFQRLRNA